MSDVEEKRIAAKDEPIIQAQAKPLVDQSQVLRIFGFVDAVTRELLALVEPAPVQPASNDEGGGRPRD